MTSVSGDGNTEMAKKKKKVTGGESKVEKALGVKFSSFHIIQF